MFDCLKKVFLATVIVLVATPLYALDRPRIGLVLSGGGARGAAHIGVLKYLERNRIPVDVIAGTSMGAIVGGLYASGLRAAEIEQIAVEMDWAAVLDDSVARQDLSGQRKQMQDLFSISASPGYSKGALQIPSGAIQGQKIILKLQEITRHVSHIRDFSQLPIPFKAVATDIVTGEEVVLERGDLALAMRASMGVPAVFAPIRINGRLLLDGGMTNNLPVDVARQMGADILIVVNVSSPMLEEEGVTDLVAITDQLTRMLTGVNTQYQMSQIADQDIYIEPQLGEFSSAAFDAASEAVALGHLAAMDHEPGLMALSEPSYRPPERPVHTELPIRHIELVNNSGLRDDVLERLVSTKTGVDFDLPALEKDLSRIHGLGHFELVSFNLSESSEGADLTINAETKSWGPNYLHFGIDAESEFEHNSRVSLLVGYSQQEVTDLGAEWVLMAAIGDEPRLGTRWYQPFNADRSWFFQTDALYSDEALFEYAGNDRIATFALRRTLFYTGLGYEYQSKWRVTLGLEQNFGNAVLMNGPPGTPGDNYNDGGLRLGFLYDTRDDIDFPSRGTLVDVDVRAFMDGLGSNQDYRQWEVNVARHMTHRKHNLGLGLNLGGINGPSHVGSVFRLGGYGQLTGLSADQLQGNHKAVASVIYYRRYDRIPVLDGIAGAIFEYGGTWNDRDLISADTAVFSAGLFVGADTPIGTLQIGFAMTNNGDSTIFSRIGRVF